MSLKYIGVNPENENESLYQNDKGEKLLIPIERNNPEFINDEQTEWIDEIMSHAKEIFQHLDGDYNRIHDYGSSLELARNQMKVIQLYFDAMRIFLNHDEATSDIDWIISTTNMTHYFNTYQMEYITL